MISWSLHCVADLRVFHAPAALPPVKDPLDGVLCVSQIWTGHGVKEKNSQPTPLIEPPSSEHPSRN